MISLAARRQLLSLIAVFLAHYLHGCKQGWTSAAASLLMAKDSPFEASISDVSWFISLPSIGDIVSVLTCCAFGKKFARKSFIVVGLCMSIIAWILLTISKTTFTLTVSMVFLGMNTGMLSIMSGIYIAEISSPKYRSVFVTMSSIIGMFGVESQYVILLWQNYHLLSIIPLIISIIALIFTSFMKESPYHLASVDLHEQARRNLSWLNGMGKEENCDNFENLMKYIDEESIDGDDVFKLLKIPDNYKLLLAIIVIRVTSMANTTFIVLRSGTGMLGNFEEVNKGLFINIFGISRICFTILSLITIKKFGRRSLILFGFFAAALIQLLCGLCFFVEEKFAVPYLPHSIAILLVLMQVTTYLSLTPSVNALKIEVFPHNLKEFSMCAVKISVAGASFLMSKFFFPLAAVLGTGFNILLYSIIAMIGGMYACFCVKETKDKTLLEIRRNYKSNDKIRAVS